MGEPNDIPGYDTNIEIVEYDSEWADRYEREAERLREAGGDELVGIEHFGSTSVPGLPAKPIIDIGLMYTEMEAARDAVERFESLGYRFGRERDGWFSLYRWADDRQQFNVGVCSVSSETWRRGIVFREYLQDHPDAREEYAAIKRAAAEEHPRDASSYTEAKSDTIDSILQRANEKGYEEKI